MSCRNISCSGCMYSQPNQLAHMEQGGCLFFQSQEEDVWETSSEDSEEDASEVDASFIERLAAEIQTEQAAALEDGARRLLDMDFGDDDSSEFSEQEEEEPKKEPEPEKEPLFEAPIPLGECPICYEELKMIDFTVTKCGHTFHSSCVFKAMEQNVDCPMCRCQLLEVQEEEEEGEDDDGEEGEEDQEGDEDSEGDEEPKVTLEQLYTKLQNMGYSPLDILAYAVENANLKRQDEVRNTQEFIDEFADKAWGVIVGDISLAHVDQRTYAQVASQIKELVHQPQPQEQQAV